MRRKLAIGPRAVHRQVEKRIGSRKVRRQRSKELREQVEWFRNKQEKQGWRGKSGPARRESGLEEDRGMEEEEEFENGENKTKLDERRKRLQRELRNIEKLSCIPQETSKWS